MGLKIFLAGTSVSNPAEESRIQALFKEGHKLHSYFHSQNGGFERGWFLMNTENEVCLFLDSGAYSALTQGAEIDIYEYINFIKEHSSLLELYANLDVLPKISDGPRKLRKSAELTLRNQKIMEEHGLSPLPVFHVGQPYEFLENYIEKYEYIALGAMVGKPKNILVPWLDTCFSKYICDENGMPKVKVHGFGVTALSILTRYPWYSVDSTSWVVTGRMGGIYVPQLKNGEWVYDENSWKIAVSSKSPNRKEAGAHIDTISPKQKEIILQYIKEKGYSLGKSEFHKKEQDYDLKENEKWAEKKPKNKASKRLVETILEPGISNMYQLRDEMNILYFLDLEKSLPEWPWAFKQTGVRGFSF